jgi:CheY-like chemotaxis protein
MSDKEILYIEDNFHNRRIVRKILERQGYTLHEREDGLEGYEFLKELKPGVVLLDISLPSMDGMEIARRVKEDPEVQHIYLIALTASAMQGDRERFLDAGCDDYLSKPFRALDLVALVNKYADLVAANVPAPPPQPSEMHDTGPLEEKKVEEPPEPVEIEAEAPAETEVETVAEQEFIEVQQIEEAVEVEAEPETEQAVSAAPEPAEEIEEAALEPVVDVPVVEPVVEVAASSVEVEEIEPVVEAVEAVDETQVEEAPMEEAVAPSGEVEETNLVVEAVEAVDEIPIEKAGVVEEDPVVMEPVEPVYAESVDEPAAAEENPEVEEYQAEAEQAAPLMEETTAVEAPAVEEKIQTAGLDQESIEAGLKKLEEESAEPVDSEAAWKPEKDFVDYPEEETEAQDLSAVVEQTDAEEPAARVEAERASSSPAVVEDLSKKNGNLGSEKPKNTEEIDAIKAGIMGAINPDNLRPVDPNNHRE